MAWKGALSKVLINDLELCREEDDIKIILLAHKDLSLLTIPFLILTFPFCCSK